jgi:hypothetical protein
MLAFAYVMHLLANELAGLRTRGLAGSFVGARPLEGFLLWHS